jgi:uncharacterized protein YjbJ (UPF0337 family)
MSRSVRGIVARESSATDWSSVRTTITFGRTGAWRAGDAGAAVVAPATTVAAHASPAAHHRTGDSMRIRLATHPAGKLDGYRPRIPRARLRKDEMPENADDAKGRVKEAAGSLTGDDSLKNEGKVDQATGKVKETVGDAADKVKDVVNPDDK